MPSKGLAQLCALQISSFTYLCGGSWHHQLSSLEESFPQLIAAPSAQQRTLVFFPVDAVRDFSLLITQHCVQRM